jgi:hypothetical protein
VCGIPAHRRVATRPSSANQKSRPGPHLLFHLSGRCEVARLLFHLSARGKNALTISHKKCSLRKSGHRALRLRRDDLQACASRVPRGSGKSRGRRRRRVRAKRRRREKSSTSSVW